MDHKLHDLDLLRHAFEHALEAAASGDEPFGAVVTIENRLVAHGQNHVLRSGDPTRHAEIEAIRAASKILEPKELERATIYSSTEPCPMCAGAIYWANLPKLVFGCSQEQFRGSARPTWSISRVWPEGSRKIEIVGPLLAEEGMAVHRKAGWLISKDQSHKGSET